MITSDRPSPLYQAHAITRISAFFAGWMPWLVALGLSAGSFAQTPTLRCAELLDAKQIKVIFGAGMIAAAPRQHEAGESECVWRRGRDSAGASLSLRFFDRQAIASNPVSRTLDGYYEMLVKAGEEVGDKRREAVAGVPRAALIQANPQILLLVQRGDGVVRIVLGNLSRAQAVAVAKVIAVS